MARQKRNNIRQFAMARSLGQHRRRSGCPNKPPRLSKVNAQPSIVAPHHFAGLGWLIWHDKFKRCGNSVRGLHHKTCTNCRKIADRALHLPMSEKNLSGFKYASTRNLAAFVHRGTGPSPLHYSLGYLPNRQKRPDAWHLAGPFIGLEVSCAKRYCNRRVICACNALSVSSTTRRMYSGTFPAI